MEKSEIYRRVTVIIEGYLSAVGQDCPRLVPSTNLVRDTGLSSDDGVNLVLDLCTEFDISLPEDFNAIVHDDGKRDRTFDELVTCVATLANTQEQLS